MGDEGLGLQLRLFAHVLLAGESGCSGMWYCNDANKSQRIVVKIQITGMMAPLPGVRWCQCAVDEHDLQ